MMLNETEYFISESKKLLEKVAEGQNEDRARKANAYATLALVHAVNQLNKTLKAKTVVQKKEPGWTV